MTENYHKINMCGLVMSDILPQISSLFLFFFFFIIYVLFLLLHYTSSRAIKSFIKWQQSDKLLRNSGHINQNKATSLLQLFSNIRYYAKEGISKNKHKNETISLHNHSQGTCSDFTNAFNQLFSIINKILSTKLVKIERSEVIKI